MTKKTFGPQTWQVGYNTLQIPFDGGTWRRERIGSTYWTWPPTITRKTL